jgi:hypothetical protein
MSDTYGCMYVPLIFDNYIMLNQVVYYYTQVMEEREIKMMRKEMVPKAQLMPAFDKPFHPQRQLFNIYMIL